MFTRGSSAAFKALSFSRSLSTQQKIPAIELRHASPGNLVSIPQTGIQLLIGVPAAFSPGCSNKHIPGYLNRIKEFQDAKVNGISIISVNDVFVMNAWQASLLEAAKESTATSLAPEATENGYLKFLADHDGAWINAAELSFDSAKMLGTDRSKRFAAIVEDNVVTQLFVEPDNTGVTISSAESVLAALRHH